MSNTSYTADDTIDGFQLIIEGLKLNGIKNIYCVPGIPMNLVKLIDTGLL